jgi:hypothetical protein
VALPNAGIPSTRERVSVWTMLPGQFPFSHRLALALHYTAIEQLRTRNHHLRRYTWTVACQSGMPLALTEPFMHGIGYRARIEDNAACHVAGYPIFGM